LGGCFAMCAASIDGASPGCHIEPSKPCMYVRSIAGRGAATRFCRSRQRGGESEECGSLVFVRIAGWLDKFGSILEERGTAKEPKRPMCLLAAYAGDEMGTKGSSTALRALSDGRHFPSQGPPRWSDMKHATPGQRRLARNLRRSEVGLRISRPFSAPAPSSDGRGDARHSRCDGEGGSGSKDACGNGDPTIFASFFGQGSVQLAFHP
jgi:hypothetical protein